MVCDVNHLATACLTSFEMNERLEMGLYELRESGSRLGFFEMRKDNSMLVGGAKRTGL